MLKSIATVLALSLGAPLLFAQTGTPPLFEQSGFPSDGDPEAFVIEDFDGNGLPDVVLCDSGTAGLQVRLQSSTGVYRGPFFYGAGVSYGDVVTGDMNGDGVVDLVAVDGGSPSSLAIGLGDGSGGFADLSNQTLSGNAKAIGLADINKDGELDVVVALSDLGGVSVSLGVGDGTLSAESLYPGGALANDLDIGDLNGDGNLDVVTANGLGLTFSILIGNGMGQFAAPLSVSSIGSGAVRLGDLDGDGDLDLVGVSMTTDALVVIENRNGVFQPPVTTTIVALGLTLELLDDNGDGNLDVAVGYGEGPGLNFSGVLASIYIGDGAFGFSSPKHIGSSYEADTTVALALEDMNGDGIKDLVASLPDRHATLIIPLDALGKASVPDSVSVQGRPETFDVADMNGDGLPDLVIGSVTAPGSGAGVISVNLADGLGGYASALTFGGTPEELQCADFTNDGILDVIYVDAGNQLCIVKGTGSGSLVSTNCLNTQNGTITTFSIGDMDMDGNLDALSINRNNATLLVSRGRGNGTLFQGGATTIVGGVLSDVLATDLDLDGDTDVVIPSTILSTSTEAGLVTLFNDGLGGLPTRAELPLSSLAPTVALAGDFNQDGIIDLAAGQVGLSGNAGRLHFLQGTGGGAFDAPQSIPFGATAYMEVGDFNGDGWLDIGGADTGIYSIAVNDCAGGFANPYSYPGIKRELGIATPDGDGDGFSEMLVLDTANDLIVINKNLRPTLARSNIRNGSGTNPQCFASLNAPILGLNWIAEVDTSAFPAANLTLVLAYDRGLPGVPTPFGELLIAPEPIGVFLAGSTQTIVGSSSTHSIAIPPTADLLGMFVSTQAAVLGGGISLCNALDLVLGDS